MQEIVRENPQRPWGERPPARHTVHDDALSTFLSWLSASLAPSSYLSHRLADIHSWLATDAVHMIGVHAVLDLATCLSVTAAMSLQPVTCDTCML